MTNYRDYSTGKSNIESNSQVFDNKHQEMLMWQQLYEHLCQIPVGVRTSNWFYYYKEVEDRIKLLDKDLSRKKQ